MYYTVYTKHYSVQYTYCTLYNSTVLYIFIPIRYLLVSRFTFSILYDMCNNISIVHSISFSNKQLFIVVHGFKYYTIYCRTNVGTPDRIWIQQTNAHNNIQWVGKFTKNVVIYLHQFIYKRKHHITNFTRQLPVKDRRSTLPHLSTPQNFCIVFDSDSFDVPTFVY